MRPPTRSLAVIAASLGLAVAPAAATANGTHHGHHHHHGTTRPSVVPAAVFLPKAASANQFEIVTGRLAQQQAQSAAIRDLGAMFVADHTALLQQGAQVAQQLGVNAPPQLDPRQQAIANQLAKLSGSAFDAAWLRAQLSAHEQALALALAAAIRGENTAVRTLAQGALPVITKHFGELIDLAQTSGTRP
jgi:predicted outer membrane protein